MLPNHLVSQRTPDTHIHIFFVCVKELNFDQMMTLPYIIPVLYTLLSNLQQYLQFLGVRKNQI